VPLRPLIARIARRALVLVAVLACGRAEASHSVVRHYSTQDGLPQLQVLAICQDRSGYLWVGTQTGGVGRYNGHRWVVYDATSGLPGGTLYTLTTSPDGTVYVGTSGGAARFDGERWMPVGYGPADPSLAVHAILVSQRGQIWLGTPKGLRTVAPAEGARALAVRSATTEISDAPVNCIVSGPDGTLWVGTGKGLARVAPSETPTIEAVSGLPPREIAALLPLPSGRLLVSVAETGLFEGSPGSFSRVGDDQVPGRRVRALHAGPAGTNDVWIGTLDRGAYRWDGRFYPFGPGQGMKELSINSIFRDREGLLWFGGDSGLWKRAPAAFVTWDEAEGIPEGAAVFSMAEDRAGTLWLVLSEHGLLRVREDGSHRLFTQQDFEASRPNDVTVDRDGSVLVAAEGGLFQVAGDRVTRIPLPGGALKGIRAILRLRSGDLALGTQSRGLVLFRNGQVVKIGAPVGLKINSLFETAEGTLWAGGEGWGAVAIRDGLVRRSVTMKEGLPSDQVNQVFVDSRGVLWVSTDRGVLREEPSGERWVLDRSNGLPDSFVYWVGEDREEVQWVGTNRGVARIKPDGSIEVYTSRHGLGSDECNEGGFFVDSHGRVYIGTTGASLFIGPQTVAGSIPPAVVLEETLVGGKHTPRFGELPVPAGSGPITFRFAGLSFGDENALRFRYRLSGLSEEWTNSEASQYEITYGAVPAGGYQFEVEAVADGRRSAAPAQVTFTVRPRWWRTNEFLAAALAGVVVLGFAIVRVRERRLEVSRRRLEKEVADRTEELRLANARLEELAVRDDLTGLANRRRILERLSEGIALSRRQKSPLSVGLADLDYFKEVNDQLGHAAGDLYLRKTAGAMKDAQRDVDDLGRYGGDEFLALLPGCDGLGALAAAERIRDAVSAMGHRPMTANSGSLSIGLATLDDSVRDGAELIQRADLALYEAKRLGRNRIVVWKAG
jgi:diguanylate cyclase (GGDEF)-like protein